VPELRPPALPGLVLIWNVSLDIIQIPLYCWMLIHARERRPKGLPRRQLENLNSYRWAGITLGRNTTQMKTLLVLEDEALVMKLLLHILRDYTVLAATTVEQSLHLFVDHGRQIDLLVADVELPTGSGIDVALRLRAEIPDLKILITSGYPLSHRDIPGLEGLGSNLLVIQKPFSAEDLLNAVRQLIGPKSSAATPE
jgi:CheY-like chemotaxis protein